MHFRDEGPKTWQGEGRKQFQGNSYLLINDDLMFLRFLWGNQTLYSSQQSPSNLSSKQHTSSRCSPLAFLKKPGSAISSPCSYTAYLQLKVSSNLDSSSYIHPLYRRNFVCPSRSHQSCSKVLLLQSRRTVHCSNEQIFALVKSKGGLGKNKRRWGKAEKIPSKRLALTRAPQVVTRENKYYT